MDISVGEIDPTLDVAETPVKTSSTPYTNPGVPTETVADCPDNPIDISVGDNVPTVAVAERPEGSTITVGEVSAYNEQGWGRDPWGYENWGESAMTVVVDVSSSGVATASVGNPAPIAWGRVTAAQTGNWSKTKYKNTTSIN